MKNWKQICTALAVGLFGAALVFAADQTKPPQAPSSPSPSSDEEVMNAEPYVYRSLSRRDPFRSLLVHAQPGPGQRPPGVAGLSVDGIDLEGIWQTRAGYVAQVRGADNRSYLLRKGDKLFDGEVLDVENNQLVLRQNVNDPTSVKPFRDVVKLLHSGKTQ